MNPLMQTRVSPARIFPLEGWTTQEDAVSRSRFISCQANGSWLQEVHEVTLAGGGSKTLIPGQQEYLFLLPVVGRHNLFSGDLYLGGFTPGQWVRLPLQAGEELRLHNPSESELSFGYWFRLSLPSGSFGHACTAVFDPALEPDRLSWLSFGPSTETEVPSFALGRYAGRAEDQLQLERPKDLFFLVLQGAAEAEGRLLQAGEALLLPQCSNAEWEALTNDAIVGILLF